MARAGSSTPPASRRNPLAPRDNAICIPIPRARKPTDQASERSSLSLSLVSYFFLSFFLLFFPFFFSLSSPFYPPRCTARSRSDARHQILHARLDEFRFNVPRPRSFAPWNLLGKPETRPGRGGGRGRRWYRCTLWENANFFPLFWELACASFFWICSSRYQQRVEKPSLFFSRRREEGFSYFSEMRVKRKSHRRRVSIKFQ